MNHEKALEAVAALRVYTEDFVEESTRLLAKNRLTEKDKTRLHGLEIDAEGINELTDYLGKIENILTEKIGFRKES